ncbi:hypothetical protein COCHEDRAFT_1219688 [Bipolaris maydis C5]|uniref:Retrotransposon gag domain-containing protein n=1 Tax=Cochliobolus heterostrophus (strain C5 / ATCC 48332 / race O) TaxID=701091 RepID=M2TEQ2_COCH5|nr:hypothetical protein COCHEDRAFT_1219688 [Bipolaris maydis C5]
MATLDKYDGNREGLRTFLTNIELYCGYHEEMGRIFREVDAESQAEKAISRLRQTKAVSAYTAEFKQL